MSVGTGMGHGIGMGWAGTSGMGRAVWRPPAGGSSGVAGGAGWGLGEAHSWGAPCHCLPLPWCQQQHLLSSPHARGDVPEQPCAGGVSHLNQVRASIPGEGSIHLALQPWPAVSLGPGVPPVPPRVQPEQQSACRMHQPRPCPTAPFPLPHSPMVQPGPQTYFLQPTAPQSHSLTAQPGPQPVAP